MFRKILIFIGLLMLIVGCAFFIKKSEEEASARFLLLEIKTNNATITIEPKKLKAYANLDEISLTTSRIDSYSKYFNKYFRSLKNLSIKENVKYLWTIKYKDNKLNDYYIGGDEYPNDWEIFLNKTDVLLGKQYLGKKVVLTKEQKLNDKAVTSIDFVDTCNAYNCIYNANINKTDVLIQFNRKKQDDGFGEQTLIVDGKMIIKDDFIGGGPVKLEVLANTIIVLYHYGNDYDGYVLKGYNLNGQEIFEYANDIDNNYPGMYLNTNDFEIINNKIIIEASREIINGEILIGSNNSISYCDSDIMLENDVDDSFVVSATYEIEYEEDNYLPIRKIGSKTMKDLKLLESCIEEE